jgi:hypothetical protein
MWQLLPASSVWGLAMKVTLTPMASASSFIDCFISTWLSAMARASS